MSSMTDPQAEEPASPAEPLNPAEFVQQVTQTSKTVYRKPLQVFAAGPVAKQEPAFYLLLTGGPPLPHRPSVF